MTSDEPPMPPPLRARARGNRTPAAVTLGSGLSVHRYPRRALTGDYVRAGVGVVLTGGPLLFAPTAPVASAVLGVLVLVFTGFGAITALRQVSSVRLSDEEISHWGLNRVRLGWRNIESVRLRYFSTRHDHSGGWMQLRLSAWGRSLTLESSIDGFLEIATRAAAAAETNRLRLSRATIGNFAALGIVCRAGDTHGY